MAIRGGAGRKDARDGPKNLCPFDELETAGMTVHVRTQQSSSAEAFVTVRKDVVPFKEKKLLASGKVSEKEMSKTRVWAYYQDHVCSAALRVGRELFHLLPIGTAQVNVAAPMIDRSTGHEQPRTIVSVEFEREALQRLNFERIDASEAVGAFRHAMAFKKGTGFAPVEMLAPLASAY